MPAASASPVKDSPAEAIEKYGFHIFDQVLSVDEVGALRAAANRHFRTSGRRLPNGGVKQANATVEIPAINWLFHHPRVLECFRSALGSDSIMFTGHADVQKDVPGGWHKDDGTDPANPKDTGYFSQFAYDASDCKLYKMGLYLQAHDRNQGGLWVRDGSHRFNNTEKGADRYLGPRLGGALVFDVRISHSGQFKSRAPRVLLKAGKVLPSRLAQPAITRSRALVRALTGRERVACFFTFGLPNAFTIEFARNNMSRQLLLTPGTSPRLPDELANALRTAGVLLAQDHFGTDEFKS
jgi:hypothetical protein